MAITREGVKQLINMELLKLNLKKVLVATGLKKISRTKEKKEKGKVEVV